MTGARPRVVLDTCVLIAAALSPRGTCAGLLRAWQAGSFELVVSPHLLWELRVVLERERFRRYLSIEDVRTLLAFLRERALVVPDPPVQRGLTPDPGDDYLPALAAAAGASFLVSADRHLTDVPGLRPPVVGPDQLLDRLVTRPPSTARLVSAWGRRSPTSSPTARRPAGAAWVRWAQRMAAGAGRGLKAG